MDYTSEELTEAKRQIDSIVHKLHAAVQSLERKEHPERLKAQITLARRRIAALELSRSDSTCAILGKTAGGIHHGLHIRGIDRSQAAD